MMHSIQRRLLLALLLVLLLGAVVTALVVFHEARAEANVLFDEQLRQIAQSLPSQLVQPGTTPRSSVGNDIDGVVVQIYNLNGERLYLSHPDALLPPRIVLGFSNGASTQGEWRVYSALFVDNVIEVAQPMRVRSELAAAVALRTAAPLVALVPVLALLIWFTVGRGLAPLRDLARAVSSRSADALDPLPTAKLPAEVTPLVLEINLLLDRVQSALAAQRAFIADAAHELRTPVTAIDLQLQLAERALDVEAMRAALTPLRAGLARSQRLIEQLLTLARNQPEASTLERDRFDLQAMAREVLAELAPFAIRKGSELELADHAPLFFGGNQEALRVALANLVDNALRYTPGGARVLVHLEAGTEHVAMVVEDNGPGLAADEAERVFDRFYRGRGAKETGSGLGLSIVERIVQRHGGSIHLAQSPWGQGLSVQLLLPRGVSDQVLLPAGEPAPPPLPAAIKS
jgi:two-component system OmpR family sensor kinase